AGGHCGGQVQLSRARRIYRLYSACSPIRAAGGESRPCGRTSRADPVLALHGGPLWQPLCYAQISGLSVATFVELFLVPILYAIFVLDLKMMKREAHREHEAVDSAEESSSVWICCS